jgi:hypothetical protein
MKSNMPIRWLEITTTIGCKIHCSYCPQGKLLRAYFSRGKTDDRLSLENLCKCVDTVPKSTRILFLGFAEPWLNAACTEMVSYVHECGFQVGVFTTLVGISSRDINQLKNIPFKSFVVHLPDDKDLTRIKVDQGYLKILNKVVEANIKNLRFLYRGHRRGGEDLHPGPEQILKSYGIRCERWGLTSRAGNVESSSPPRRIDAPLKRCPFLHRNVLLPNGVVVLCCMDWGLRHRLGNLIESDYDSLFKGSPFLAVLNGHKDGSFDILCRTCEWARVKGVSFDALRNISSVMWRMKWFVRAKLLGGPSTLPWE